MDKELYKMMHEIIEEKKTDFTKDINFIGSITSDEESKTGSVKITTDIFMMIDEMPDGTIIQKFYDDNKNFIGGSDRNGKIYPSPDYAQDDLSFLAQIEELSKGPNISLNEFDEKLDTISKKLGISKNEIIEMSDVDLDQKVNDLEENSEKLTLDDDEKEEESTPEEINSRNEEALQNVPSKQEINLNQKIDDRHSLGEVLGVPAGSTLISVFSDSIANNKNSTRFSAIIKYPDGSLHTPENLVQEGGTSSDKTFYETNRDGSEVNKLNVQSSYSIKSPIVENAMLSFRYGSMGYIEVSYGIKDRTSNKEVFSQSLETERSYYTTYKVRDEFNQNKGMDNISENIDEIHSHEEHGCTDISLDEADGRKDTGHSHEDAVVELIMTDKDKGKMIRDNFDDETVAIRYEQIAKANKGRSTNEIIKMTIYSLEADLYAKDKNASKEYEEENDEHIPTHDFYNH